MRSSNSCCGVSEPVEEALDVASRLLGAPGRCGDELMRNTGCETGQAQPPGKAFISALLMIKGAANAFFWIWRNRLVSFARRRSLDQTSTLWSDFECRARGCEEGETKPKNSNKEHTDKIVDGLMVLIAVRWLSGFAVRDCRGSSNLVCSRVQCIGPVTWL